MQELADKEKVLQYLQKQKRDGKGRVYLAMNSYSAVSDVFPEHFIEQLRILEYEGLIKCSYTGSASPKSVCNVTMLPPAISYFEDIVKAKKGGFKKQLGLTTREIIIAIISVVAGAVATKILDILFK